MPDFLDRIIATRSALAVKAAPVAPSSFAPLNGYQAGGYGGGVPTYPMSFPGFADRQQGINRNLNDEQRARLGVITSWVYSDCNVIAQELSTANLVMKRLTKGSEGETDVTAHPLELLWERPNNFMGRSYLMQFWCWQLLLSGEAYLYAAPDENGNIVELWPVPSFAIQPIPDANTFIGGYLFKAGPDAPAITIAPEHIIYSRIPHPFDLRRGLSPLVAAFLPAQVDQAQANWNRSFFSENNATPTSIVSMPKDLGKPDFIRVVEELKQLFGGAKGGTLYTRAGEIDVKQLQFNPEQMQFIAMRLQNRDEIDRIFGIPGGYWDSKANRANAEHGNGALIGQAVWPKLVLLHEDMNAQFVERWYGPDVRAEFDDIRPKNIDQELKQIESKKAYTMIDELRLADGLKPLGDARGSLLVAQIGQQTAAAPTLPTDAATTTPHLLTDHGTVPALPAGTSGGTTGGIGGASATPTDATTPATPDAAMPPLAVATDAPGGATLIPADGKALDLERWERKAVKAVKAGKSALVRFASQHITDDDRAWLLLDLAVAETPHAVRQAFAGKAAPKRVRAAHVAGLFDDDAILERVKALVEEVG